MRGCILSLGLVVVALAAGGIQTFAQEAPAEVDAPEITVRVDPRIELLSTIFRLAGNPEYAKRMNALRSTLLKQLREQADPRVLGGEVLFDSYPATTPWLPIHKARVKREKENARN